MIEQLLQVMIYVEDVTTMKEFWINQLGFNLIEESLVDSEMHFIEIAASENSQTHLVLFDRAVIAQQSPELNLGTPSLMFQTPDATALYYKFRDQGITVGELVAMPMGHVFNFADPEGHYFAVKDDVKHINEKETFG